MIWKRLAKNPWEGLVGVERDADGFRVADSSTGETPAGQDGRRLPPTRALPDLVRDRALRGRPAAALLEGNDVHVRRLSLPALKRHDLLSAITLECRKHVPYPLEEAEIRFEVLGASGQVPGGQDLLVAVAPRRAVEEMRA
ncbi:MAG TPA: pilus assembly protein PilM, partial [Candidatus Eisenbacteria bacterium]|nr:pilus assembly protein PilM [Candidatus Eisenbacteria bacterium]